MLARLFMPSYQRTPHTLQAFSSFALPLCAYPTPAGVCLWELYCGTPPWRRNTAHNRHYGGEADPHSDSLSVGSSVEDTSIDGGALGGRGGGAVVVTASGADVLRFPRSTPPEFSGLVVSCLASEPSVRPTVREVHDALLRLQRRYG